MEAYIKRTKFDIDDEKKKENGSNEAGEEDGIK